uniref:DUF5641 domain-containing protein n=1 Tax=Amphimedon queenslandica TaxID=400682 RepID=A0A1X7UEA9_AMPQE
MEWDEEIQGELLELWTNLITCIRDRQPVIVPRCYFEVMSDHCGCRLIGFSDSSAKAYAAVVYLQWDRGDSKPMAFIASKTRVAPLKSLTIPRLELLGAFLLARLINCVHEALREELKLLPSRCYTDSQVALYWIQGERKEWKPFVCNRVKEIRKLIPSEQWSHCNGKQNPADIPCRGMSVEELRECTLWWEGPKDLGAEKNICDQMPGECLDEMRASERRECNLLMASENIGITNIINIKRYSVYSQLISVTGYVLQFIEIVLLRVRGNVEMRRELMILKIEAEIIWIKEIQKDLVEDKNFGQWKGQLQLFKDDRGIWRCGGRLTNANLPFETKHPILLPGRGHFAELIIRRAHEKVFHNGVKDTLTELRSRFWVLRGRAVGQSYAVPPMPPLPTYRVSERPPFYYTGVEVAGPIFVKNSAHELGGKAWSFKRFIARRGLPRKMLSDNAKTFKKIASLLKEIEDLKDVKRYFSDHKIQWNFNVEKSPWWGGVFERLIRSVKRYDLDEPITPSHLLIGRRLTSLPDDICCTEDEFTLTPPTLTRRMEFLNRQLSQFWNRWRKEYLLELREAHRIHLRNSPGRYWIQVGDIVVIHSDEKKRGFWSAGRVEELLTGRDGNVRAAVVRVCAGSRRFKLLRRPIQRLFPIEVHRDDQGDPELVEEIQLPPSNEVEDITNIPCDDLTVDDSPSEEINTVQDSVSSVVNDDEELVTNKRPRRAAAFAARDHIKAQSLM